LFVVGSDKNSYLVAEDVYRHSPLLTTGDAATLLLSPTTIGQTLAKVVQENIDKMKVVDDKVGRPDFQPGYWFDLRLLRLIRKDNVPDIPVDNRPSCPIPPTVDVTKDVADNLYVVMWTYPHLPDNNEYEIRYVTSDIVTKTRAPESDAQAIQKYFVSSSSQVGAFTDKERCYLGMHGACYIANLASFRRQP
jgi:hypothetical protein